MTANGETRDWILGQFTSTFRYLTVDKKLNVNVIAFSATSGSERHCIRNPTTLLLKMQTSGVMNSWWSFSVTRLCWLYSRFSAGLSAVLFIMVEISTSPFVDATSLILHKAGEKQATEKQFLSTM